MNRSEYMMLPLDIIPNDFVKDYGLKNISRKEKVYMEITKGMYGLPQAGLLENKQLQNSLKKDGYFPCENSIGVWKHQSLPVTFTLVVDDFKVKYVGKKNS